MRITADTNILVRAILGDDSVQTPLAQSLLEAAELVALPLTALCELAWVATRTYKVEAAAVAQMIRTLIAADNISVNVPAVEAGLALLDAGGDFADGVIAHEGRWLGGETFISFDKRAVRLLHARGEAARVLA